MNTKGFFSSNGRLETNNKHNSKMHYGHRIGIFYYDNYYQMIAIIIIFIIIGIIFFVTYKPPVNDPIKDTKKMIISIYISIILVLGVFTILINYFSKNKNVLIKRLIAILLISIITIFVFFAIKINMDSNYTRSKFEQIYEQEYGEQKSNNKNKIKIGLTGVEMKNEKENYIDECIEAYNIFGIKMYGIFVVNILFIILLIYQIVKVLQIKKIKNRLSKEDDILFDEEENVKF